MHDSRSFSICLSIEESEPEYVPVLLLSLLEQILYASDLLVPDDDLPESLQPAVEVSSTTDISDTNFLIRYSPIISFRPF